MRLLIVTAAILSSLAFNTKAWGETPGEVALRARSLLVDKHTFGVGVLSTRFPSDYDDETLRGQVSSGAEYFASCYDDGDLLMLAMPVSQNWRNTLNSERRNATISVTSSADPQVPDPRHARSRGRSWDPSRPDWRRGMPSKQRITLYGHFERVQDDGTEDLAACYLARHPDARHWAPGAEDSPHVAYWIRFVVSRVYRVGGFGDESNIGWVDMSLWHEQDVKDKSSPLQRLPTTDSSHLFIESPTMESAYYLDS